MKFLFSIIFFSFLFCSPADAQKVPTEKVVTLKDSASTKKEKTDSIPKKKVQVPRIAATRSAIIPGWGQLYNKKIWKVPIIYTGLGISGYVFLDNIKTYKEYKFAYAARIAAQTPPKYDSTGYKQLKDIYKVLSPNTIRAARDQFRAYVDYSALVFLLLWGLNVVDATVDAHLKSFDVSPDLSLQLKPGHSELAGTNGVSLVLHIGK